MARGLGGGIFLQNTEWMTPFVEIKSLNLNPLLRELLFLQAFFASVINATHPHWISPAERRLSTCAAYPNPKHVFFFFVPCLTRLPHSVRSHNI
jgi:hypothetical protein